MTPFVDSGGYVSLTRGETPITWSEMADAIGVELRWDPPTAPGDYLHDAQRDELEGVLRRYNTRTALEGP